MRSIWAVLPLMAALAVSSGCVHPMIKFRKSRILDPMMDPAKTDGLGTAMGSEPQLWNERGSSQTGGSIGGSCPTCGG